jgi:transcriptional antiterminator RfaH
MPLLALEPFVYPDDLLQKPAANGDDACWWVLHTRPRAEKAMARKLLDRSRSFFLPLYQREWRHRGRLLRSHLSLFPSYLFLHGDREARLAALETNLVVNVLPVEDQAQLHADLARVYHLITTGAVLSPEDRVQPGTRVRITNGALAGLEGKVIRRGKHLKLFVEVQFLQRAVSAEIESWMIEPCAGDSAAFVGAGVR